MPLYLIPFIKRHKHHLDYLVENKILIPFMRHLILKRVFGFSIIASSLATVLGLINKELISRNAQK